MSQDLGSLDDLPRVALGHGPTPLEAMPNLARRFGGLEFHVKRDDCTGMAFGGNKVRQLEFYLGEARAEGADVVLITGVVQSNFARLAAAAARKLAMDCHVQLEERVPRSDPLYRGSGNVLLDRVLGATIQYYPEGEDEAGADARLDEIAAGLAAAGRRPYVIRLAPGHKPLGALGYVVAARETMRQLREQNLAVDEIVVPSGSGNTHAGLLFGLRALGSRVPVTGICVRRPAAAQRTRIRARCEAVARLLGLAPQVADADIILHDEDLAPWLRPAQRCHRRRHRHRGARGRPDAGPGLLRQGHGGFPAQRRGRRARTHAAVPPHRRDAGPVRLWRRPDRRARRMTGTGDAG